MKKTIVALLVVAVASAAFAGIDTAPDYRGTGLYTTQSWSFNSADNPAVPNDGWYNPNGMPTVQFNGGFWDNILPLDTFEGAEGVWVVGKFEDQKYEIIVDVPNYDNNNPLKKIRIQLDYYTDAQDPLVFVLPEGDETMFLYDQPEITQINDKWSHAVYDFELRPNPSWEMIVIRPKLCASYIDELIIDTICIPEPLTLALLGIGGLFLRKRS